MISVVVTSYNRAHVVSDAITSALEFVSALGGDVTLVDDASTDQTADVVQTRFGSELAGGRLSMIRHDRNRGVTAAKNSGFDSAGHPWVAFLDSDDRLLPPHAAAAAEALNRHRNTPVVFFRCIDENRLPVGEKFQEPQTLDFVRYVQHVSYGESLVVINKALTGLAPFDEDLRGYEGLGCARLIKALGPAILFPLAIRIYDRSQSDRLSSVTGVLRRARLIGIGHFRLIKLSGRLIPISNRIILALKAIAYLAVGTVYNGFSTTHRDRQNNNHAS